MPVDARAQRFLDVLAATRTARTLTLTERRDALAALMRLGTPVPGVARIEALRLPGPDGELDARLITPHGSAPHHGPALVYFHGGGLVAGSLDTHEPLACALAHAGGCRVLSVGYRLAPEHPFPAAVGDAVTALAHVRSHAKGYGLDPARLGVCGDSAGANLAAVACQASFRSTEPPLALQLLLCPITDWAGTSASRRALASGHFLDQDTLERDLQLYLPAGTDPLDARVAPLRAPDLRGAPPSCIHTAEFDPLRDEGRAYALRLAQSGVAVRYTCHPGMIHLFYALGAAIPYARTALEQIGREIRTALAPVAERVGLEPHGLTLP